MIARNDDDKYVDCMTEMRRMRDESAMEMSRMRAELTDFISRKQQDPILSSESLDPVHMNIMHGVPNITHNRGRGENSGQQSSGVSEKVSFLLQLALYIPEHNAFNVV